MDEEIKDQEEVKDETPTYSPEEQKAIDLGWKPKDQWQGEEADWVPAKWWLKYGDLEQRAITLESQNKQTDKVLNVLKTRYLRLKEDALKELQNNVKRRKQEAIKNEDYERVAQLDTEAEALTQALEVKFDENARQMQQEIPNSPPPEFFQWNRENSWYKLGDTSDEMTVEADLLAAAMFAKDKNVPYEHVLKTVTDKIKRLFPDKFKKQESTPSAAAVDEGGSSGSRSRDGGKRSSRLSPLEKEMAARFGMTEEEYAKEQDAYVKRKGV